MSTHYPGNRTETRALDAYIKLVRAANTVTTRLNKALRLEDHGLTASQFGVLEALLHLGPQCQKALAEKLLVSGGNITMVIDNLEKRDLVRRERDADDRRYITVSLTASGRRLISDIFPEHVRGIVASMSALSTSDQEHLARLCKQLGLAQQP